MSESQIETVAQRYRARGLQPIFRLVSTFAPPGMDAALERCGFRYVDRSQVLIAPVNDRQTRDGLCLLDDAEAWMAAFAEASGSPVANHDVHLRMLRSIEAPCAFAVERRNGQVACVALGVVIDGRLGLFDVATAARWRRQGLATQLCMRLLGWGRARGARMAYLQVVADNTAAVALYEQLGFREAYHYWYRVAAP
ncbi:MAG TPA: GNAT family N-acetyltransferase [Nevskiaceae bacterium]|nr:GNAT family N-acetyltransferase [Nevskiaceae bacterium]